ncbi:MAG: hypothetical protein WD077_09775 [Bacteroidia bacterium]
MSSFGKILIASLTGTAFMTLFSYSISRKDKKQYREPELLNHLTGKISRGLFIPKEKHPLGYILHLLVGMGFTTAYWAVWRSTKIDPHWDNAMIFGAFSGVAGIIIWEINFKLHPDPPEIDKRNYYIQLMIAHIIFGTTAGGQWQLMEGKY